MARADYDRDVATIERTDLTAQDVPHLGEAIVDLARRGDRESLFGLLDQIQVAADAAADGDPTAAGLLPYTAKLDRLVARLAPRRDDLHLVGEALAVMDGILRRLDRLIAVRRQRADVAQRATDSAGVRPRVLAFLRQDGPVRSSRISEQLDLTRPQVSRALRELEASGQARRVGDDSGDCRARSWAAASPPRDAELLSPAATAVNG